MGASKKNTKVNSQILQRVKTRAQSKSKNVKKICDFFGITHEIQIKLVKLKHAVTQTTTNMYKCHICNQQMKNLSQLNVHLQTHFGKKIFCTVKNCHYKCSTLKSIEIHMQSSHELEKLKPLECTICSWRTNWASNLNCHIKLHHNPQNKRFNCTVCKFSTAKSAMFNTHVFKWHGGKKPVQCKDCSFRAVNNHYLALHREANHEDQTKRARPFKCPESECIYSGHTAYMLKLHIRTHTGQKPFKCQFCAYASTQRCHWKAHLRRHTNEKPYACTLCPYKCTTKCILNCHMRSHTGERPFACTKCKFRTTQRGHLNGHFRRYHTPQGKDKQFECPLCQDKFYKKSTLESHMTRHTGERPFKCRFCGRGSTQSSARNKHEKKCVERNEASQVY